MPQGSNTMAKERIGRRLFLMAVLTIQAQTSGGSSPFGQDPSRKGRPEAPGYYRGGPMRSDDEVDQQQYGYQTDRRFGEGSQGIPSRQTPPPESSYTPIHYQFHAADEKRRRDPRGIKNHPLDDLPHTELDRPQPVRENDTRTFASPRNDIVTRYMANKRGRITLTFSSGIVGMSIGSFVGKVKRKHVPALLSRFDSHLVVLVFDEQSKARWPCLFHPFYRLHLSTKPIRRIITSTWNGVDSRVATHPIYPAQIPSMASHQSMHWSWTESSYG